MASAELTRPSTLATIVTIAAPPLRQTFAWTLAGNAVYAGCQWGMISVLAKLGSATAVGQFALALAITAPVFMLTNLALRGVQATDARSEYTFADYCTLRIFGTAVALLIIVCILAVTRHDWTTAGVVALLALAKSVESFTDVIAGLLQKHERLDQVAISLTLKGIFSLLAFGLVFAYWKSVMAASAALVLSWAAVFAGYDVRRAIALLGKGESYFRWRAGRILQLAKLAAPVGIVMALGSLNVNVPRYAVQRYWGTSQLGIFAALAYLVVVANLIVNALGQSAVVRLSRSFADANFSHYVHLLRRMSLLAVAGAVVGFLITLALGRTILGLIYGPEYQSHVGLLLTMVATSGVAAVAAFLGYGMTAARRFRQQLPVMLAALAVCCLCSLVLTPRWGIMGAAVAILFSSLTQLGGSFLVVRKAVKSGNRPPVEDKVQEEVEALLAGSANE